MKKILAALAFPLCVSLSACGGDDGGGPATPSKFAVKLTYSGRPLVEQQQSSRMAAINPASGAVETPAKSDGQATVDELQKRLAAAGAGITVYPRVIDGTTLHQIVMSVNDGVGPTEDELIQYGRNRTKFVADEWVILNFQLDDMQTSRNDPAQIAAMAQFRKDLIVFQNRLSLENKSLYKILPIRTCELPAGQTAADGLIDTLNSVPGNGYLFGLWDAPDKSHMGADCRTPDKETRDAHVNAIVTRLVDSYNAVNQYVNDCRADPKSHPEGCAGL